MSDVMISASSVRKVADDISNNAKEIKAKTEILANLLKLQEELNPNETHEGLLSFTKLSDAVFNSYSGDFCRISDLLLKVADAIDKYYEPKTVDFGNVITEKELNEAYK